MTTKFGTYFLFTLHTLHTQLILTFVILCNNQRNRKRQQDACLTNATQLYSITEATQDFQMTRFSLTPLALVNDCTDSNACAGPEAVASVQFSPLSVLFYTVSYSGIAGPYISVHTSYSHLCTIRTSCLFDNCACTGWTLQGMLSGNDKRKTSDGGN